MTDFRAKISDKDDLGLKEGATIPFVSETGEKIGLAIIRKKEDGVYVEIVLDKTEQGEECKMVILDNLSNANKIIKGFKYSIGYKEEKND